MKKVIIFGSCVTRDAFEGQADFEVDMYFARSSLISLMSEPFLIGEDEVHLSSPFRKRMLLADFRKSFLDELKERRPDFLLIDFIDERFDILRVGESYLTLSKEFEESGLALQEIFRGKAQKIRRHSFWPFKSRQTVKLWNAACVRFAQQLSALGMPVVIHNALWATSLRHEGQIRKFAFQQRLLDQRQNRLLNHCYAFLAQQIPHARIITVCPSLRLAYSQHEWGLSPFHFIPEYYQDFLRKLGDVPFPRSPSL